MKAVAKLEQDQRLQNSPSYELINHTVFSPQPKSQQTYPGALPLSSSLWEHWISPRGCRGCVQAVIVVLSLFSLLLLFITFLDFIYPPSYASSPLPTVHIPFTFSSMHPSIFHHQHARSLSFSNCSSCITLTIYGTQQVSTMLHTNIPPSGATKIGICIHEDIQYSLYAGTDGKTWCSNPHSPRIFNVTIYTGLSNTRVFLNTSLVYGTGSTITLAFDACKAFDPLVGKQVKHTCGSWASTYTHNHKYLCSTESLDSIVSQGGQSWFIPPCLSWGEVCDYTGGGTLDAPMFLTSGEKVGTLSAFSGRHRTVVNFTLGSALMELARTQNHI